MTKFIHVFLVILLVTNVAQGQSEKSLNALSKEDVLNEYIQAPDNHDVDLDPRIPDALPADPLPDLNDKSDEQNLDNVQRTPTQQDRVFRSGMYTFTENCALFSEAARSSQKVSPVQAGENIWVEAHDEKWRKVFRKEGPVYLPAECVP